MHRFCVLIKDVSNSSIIISDKEQFHHLKDVLRLKIGEEVGVFDEQANEYICAIKELQKNQAILEIKSKLTPKPQKYSLTIACAIPKNVKMDDIVDKLTQLGIDRIIPLKTERVIVKLDKRKEGLRLERWRKIAQGASKQSQRNTLPIIEPIQEIDRLLSALDDYDLRLMPTLEGERKTLKEALGVRKPNNILALIGPEGDFTRQEVELALKAGFIPVTLGSLVLRVDTAAIAVASYITFSTYAVENHK